VGQAKLQGQTNGGKKPYRDDELATIKVASAGLYWHTMMFVEETENLEEFLQNTLFRSYVTWTEICPSSRICSK